MALTNSQYESIIREYEKIRDANRYLTESRREQIYQTIPEYWDLEESVSSLSVSAAKSVLEGDDTAQADFMIILPKSSNARRGFWFLPASLPII